MRKSNIDPRDRFNDFERRLYDAAVNNLQDRENPLCINNFAYALRALFDIHLARVTPKNKVIDTYWYENTNKKGEKKESPSRKDHIRYMIFANLPEDFLQELKIDPEETTDELYQIYEVLNKYTHITEKSFGVPIDKVPQESDRLKNLFIEIFIFWDKIIEEMENYINDEVLSEFMMETISEVDCLATHHYYDDVEISEIYIENIEYTTIIFTVSGEVFVKLQYGSDSDQRNDMGVQCDESFPFRGKFSRTINSTLEKSMVEKIDELEVDTDKFY